MKALKILALSTLALVATANAATYTIDEGHTHARFSIDHMGTSTNHGGFYNLTGQVEFDPVAKTGFIGITIPVANLDTNIKAFNEHLKSADFFNAEKYPSAYFSSTKWHFKGDKVTKVDGELNMMGKTHPVTLTAKQFNCYQSPMLKAEVCGGDFEATIDRTLWGIDKYANMGVAKNVTLNIQVEAFNKDNFGKVAQNTATEKVKKTTKKTTKKVTKTTKKAVKKATKKTNK